ncbi:MAG: GGDEF domain-containing protein [Burkholderiales bacterium]|nr:GGDEF domain-containing protein [Burkholderiales bacterium]
MRYTETKEDTLILVRKVLALMGAHDAALNPLTFSVFYEHAAGINPRLSHALVQAQAESARLNDAMVRTLYEAHVAEIRPEEAERIRGGIHRAMTSIMESASRTGQAAGRFGEHLEELTGALDDGANEQLGRSIEAARAGSQEMRGAIESLQQQVQRSREEIDALRADLMRTRHEASTCPLTGVLNRRGFDARLSEILERPPADGSRHFLILFDIDHFKRVNDNFGHTVGDRVIQGLGQVLRSVPTEPGMACARYGGEEFAILLPSSTLDRAVEVAEAVRARTRRFRLRERNGGKEMPMGVTVSAGVAAWQPGEDPKAFVSCADAALYRSKEGGRDRVTVA